MRGLRAALGIGGVFMIVDAIVSMDVPNDKRPWLQAGRVLRAAVGFGLGAYALVPPRPPSAARTRLR